MMLDANANIDIQNADGNTALHLTAMLYRPEIVEMFPADADVRIQNKNGDTALHLACTQRIICDSGECLKSLLQKRRVDVDIQNILGYTGLHYAFQRSFTKAIQLLIKKGGKLDIKDKCGRTPLDMDPYCLNHNTKRSYLPQ